jgi:hypothetical protein
MERQQSEGVACQHDYYWHAAINEDGWRCGCGHRPGEPPGFAPHLDRERIAEKVYAVLHSLHGEKLVYVSNGDHGDSLVAAVAKRCAAEGIYDQYSIALFLIEAMQPSRAEYWKRIGDGVIAGADPRERCACGALANHWTGGKAYCRDHGEVW